MNLSVVHEVSSKGIGIGKCTSPSLNFGIITLAELFINLLTLGTVSSYPWAKNRPFYSS